MFPRQWTPGSLQRPQQRCEPALWQLASSGTDVEIPLRSFRTTARHIQTTGHQRIDQTRAEGAQLETQLAHIFAGHTSQRAWLHAFQVGPWHLLGVPGEAFNELAARLRKVSPWALVVGYADDYVGYFPTQHAFDDATYEALSSPYDARALNQIEAALLKLIT